jgi:hypothetical protein
MAKQLVIESRERGEVARIKPDAQYNPSSNYIIEENNY